MLPHIIAAHLLRVDRSLALRHPTGELMEEPISPSHSMPAVLVIPRGGIPREPHLVTVENPHGPYDGQAPACVMTDPHTVLSVENVGDDNGHPAHPAADVVVHGGSVGCPGSTDRASRSLGDDADCDIVVRPLATRCLLRLRDGRTVEINGPAALLARAVPRWLAVYGSVLHCWVAAGLPVGPLGDAVVAAGHYHAGVSRRECHFSVAARLNVFVHRTDPSTEINQAA
jgi:hypothetical protein